MLVIGIRGQAPVAFYHGLELSCVGIPFVFNKLVRRVREARPANEAFALTPFLGSARPTFPRVHVHVFHYSIVLSITVRIPLEMLLKSPLGQGLRRQRRRVSLTR